MNRIIYDNGAGGVAVILPAPDSGLSIDEVAAKDVPEGVTFAIISADELPVDRVFRNAWEKSGAAIVESLPKCKLIAHDKRRAVRAAKFAPLDVEATIPAKAAQAEAARQVIRDADAVIQVNIDAAADVAALRAIVAQL